MKSLFLTMPFLALTVLGLSHCQLVTVPVKAAGSIVTATVETTGDVVRAPFDAVGGREARSRNDRGKEEDED